MIDIENVRWMIKNSGLSYPQLQEKTGVHMNTIRRIATDKEYNPTLSTINALLTYFRG